MLMLFFIIHRYFIAVMEVLWYSENKKMKSSCEILFMWTWRKRINYKNS